MSSYNKYGNDSDMILPPPLEDSDEFPSIPRDTYNESVQDIARKWVPGYSGENAPEQSEEEILEVLRKSLLDQDIGVVTPTDKSSKTVPPPKRADRFSCNEILKMCNIFCKLANG
jgi:hypothetical protein